MKECKQAIKIKASELDFLQNTCFQERCNLAVENNSE